MKDRGWKKHLVNDPLRMSKQGVLTEWSRLSSQRSRGLQMIEQVLVAGFRWVGQKLDDDLAQLNLRHHHLHERLVTLTRTHENILRERWRLMHIRSLISTRVISRQLGTARLSHDRSYFMSSLVRTRMGDPSSSRNQIILPGMYVWENL